MSSPAKMRKTMKTYSRNRKHAVHDEEPAPKRRRVETTTAISIPAPPKHSIADYFFKIQRPAVAPSSSPKSSPEILSDEIAIPSSPPSSPPPKSTSPILPTRRLLFSSLGKKTVPPSSIKQPLEEGSHNIQTAVPHLEKKKRLTQVQIDLGGETHKCCNVCGMDYIPSNAEDAALHKKFHATSVGGVDMGKASAETLRKRKVWAGDNGSFIAVVHRKDTLAFRNKATQVLDLVNTELGAVTIEDEKLWSQVTEIGKLSRESKEDLTEIERRARSSSDRYKMYLYIRGQKCVGACLAERIEEAYAVLPPKNVLEGDSECLAESRSLPLSISQTADRAILGISRIWASGFHRKGGIATALLNAATSDFLYGMWVPKDLVAFSQPTDSGAQLAQKWFGILSGWHVYVD